MSAQAENDHAVRTRVGWIDRSERVRMHVTGPDRAKFLHNLATNEVKRLPVGNGCEAFITSLQGRTLAYVTLLAAEEVIYLRSDAGALETLLPHFQRYGALDDVAWRDTSVETFEFHLAGPSAQRLCEAVGCTLPAEAELGHVAGAISGRPVLTVRESPAGLPGLTLIGARDDAALIQEKLCAEGESLGLVAIDPATFDALRIEAGTPVFGRDVTPDNLPQEVGRDQWAINFVKGCYLGQETVARIDALGHVNKLLKGALIEGLDAIPPPPGTALEAVGKHVGTVTSAAFSPGWNCPVLLAYIRVAHAQAGTRLSLEVAGARREAVVCDLPMLPEADRATQCP